MLNVALEQNGGIAAITSLAGGELAVQQEALLPLDMSKGILSVAASCCLCGSNNLGFWGYWSLLKKSQRNCWSEQNAPCENGTCIKSRKFLLLCHFSVYTCPQCWKVCSNVKSRAWDSWIVLISCTKAVLIYATVGCGTGPLPWMSTVLSMGADIRGCSRLLCRLLCTKCFHLISTYGKCSSITRF